MTTTSHGAKYQSDFARRFYGDGLADGNAQGEAEGKAKGKAEALLLVLESRGIHVPDAVREEILACTDDAQFLSWLRLAAHAEKIQDLDERFGG